MRTVGRLLLWIAILLAAGWFISRWAVGSSWGRDVAEHRIGRVLDLTVSVEAARLDWPLVLTFSGLEAHLPGRRDAPPVVALQELRWNVLRRHALLRRPLLRLTQGEGGDWQPAMLRHLGAAAIPATPLMTLLDRTARETGFDGTFELTNGTVVRGSDDGDQPLLGGLSWSTHRVLLEGHGYALHHRALLQTRHPSLRAEDARSLEWLAVEARPPVLMWERSDHDESLPGVETDRQRPANEPSGGHMRPDAGMGAEALAPRVTPEVEPL